MNAVDPGVFGAVLPFFAIALAATGLALRYARWRDLVDHPGERRSHAVATPRGGGIGIVAAMAFAGTLLAWSRPEWRPFLGASGLGLGLVAGIGWWDDHRPLSPWSRLAVHAAAAGLLAYAVRAGGGDGWAAALAFALALGLVNVWNFMDGIDGIAALQAIVVALAYALLADDAVVRWSGFALAAATAGFLPFNCPRARIFLGDVGSGALGYLIATLAAMLALDHGVFAASSPVIGWTLLALPPSAFLLDAALTLATRMLRGERWWTPHVEHAYQRWIRHDRSHLAVATAYAGWALASSAVALVMRQWGWRWGPALIMLAGISWCLAGAVVWKRLRTGQHATRRGDR